MRSYQAIANKHQSNYIIVSAHSGLCPFGIVSFRDCVHSGWCPFGIVSIRDGVHSGLCPSRLCPFGIVSIRAIVRIPKKAASLPKLNKRKTKKYVGF